MKSKKDNSRGDVDRFLQSLGEPLPTADGNGNSEDPVAKSGDRLLNFLETEYKEPSTQRSVHTTPPKSLVLRTTWATAGLIAAALIFGIAIHSIGPRVVSVASGSIAQAVDGTLFVNASGTKHSVLHGDVIQAGEKLQTSPDGGAVIALADGSHVELSAAVELGLSRTTDGLRIDLSVGSVIVTAAKQHGGHLYVQTKDCTVSVVGTVFAVNAESSGSRVSVLEGEVHVLQGATINVLLPGQQMQTNPAMTLVPVQKEFEWSRNAAKLMTMLALPPAAPAVPNPDPILFQSNQGQGTASIDGIVVDTDGNPLSKTIVQWETVKMTTGEDGRFVLNGVREGRRTLSVIKNGYIHPSLEGGDPHLELTLATGQQLSNIRIRLLKEGIFSGTVLDAKGEPLAAAVFPLRYTYGSTGERVPVLASSSNGIVPGELPFRRSNFEKAAGMSGERSDGVEAGRTNSRGEFRISNLEPGDYSFYVVPVARLNTAPAFLPFYYPSSTDLSGAKALRVRSADEIHFNIVAPPGETDAALRARLVNATGLTGIVFVEVRRANNSEPLSSKRAPIETNPVLDLGRLPTGSYFVEAFLEVDGFNNRAYSKTLVDMSGQDKDVDVTLTLNSGFNGSVMAESTDKELRPAPRVRFVLGSDQIPALPLVVESGPDGSFSVSNVPAGAYRIRSVAGIPEGLCLSEALEGDRNVLRNGMDLGGSNATLRMVLRESEGHVRGKVTDSTGRKVSGALVVLVPEERTIVEMYTTGTTDQNGEFDLGCVRAGNFRLYAWREMEGAAYRNSEFMRDYDAKGILVYIAKDNPVVQNLTVQEKP